MQAEVWTETIRTEDQLFSMLLPRLAAVGERGWHLPAWERIDDLQKPINKEAREAAWGKFAHTLGHTEIGRLVDKGYNVYLPPPGAKLVQGYSLMYHFYLFAILSFSPPKHFS